MGTSRGRRTWCWGGGFEARVWCGGGNLKFQPFFGFPRQRKFTHADKGIITLSYHPYNIHNVNPSRVTHLGGYDQCAMLPLYVFLDEATQRETPSSDHK